MKKLLLLAGLLVVASSAFAANPKEATSDEIGVFAEVLESLEVNRIADVQFGILERNVEKSAPVENGEFTISGSKGSKVKLLVKDTNTIGPNVNNQFKEVTGESFPVDLILTNVNMSNILNNFSNKKMTSNLKIYDEDDQLITGEVSLDNVKDPYTNGTNKKQTNKFLIKGSIKPGSEQYSGEYKGGLIVKVIHTGWINTDKKQSN